MPCRYLILTFLVMVTLLTRTVYAQSHSSIQMLELGVMAGAAWYQGSQKSLLLPDISEAIADEVEQPDEYEEPDDLLPVLYGTVAGLDVSVQGNRAMFRLSKGLPAVNSRLSQALCKHSVSQIDIRPGQLDIFPEGNSGHPVFMTLPFDDEALMPVTGYDWLDQSGGLAFVHYQSMEAIAAIAEAALSELPEPDDDWKDDEVFWFDLEESNEALFTMRLLPECDDAPQEVSEQDNTIKLVYDDIVLTLYRPDGSQDSNGSLLKWEFRVRQYGNGEGSSDGSGQSDGEDKPASEHKSTEADSKEDSASPGVEHTSSDSETALAEPASKRPKLALDTMDIDPEYWKHMVSRGKALIYGVTRTNLIENYKIELESKKKELEAAKAQSSDSSSDKQSFSGTRRLEKSILWLSKQVELMEEKDPVTHFLIKSGSDLIAREQAALVIKLEDARKAIAQVQSQKPGCQAGQTTDEWLEDESIKDNLAALSASLHKDPIEVALESIKNTGSVEKPFSQPSYPRSTAIFWEALVQTTDLQMRQLIAKYGWYELPVIREKPVAHLAHWVKTETGKYFELGFERPDAEEVKKRGYIFQEEGGRNYTFKPDDKLALKKGYIYILEAFGLTIKDLPETYDQLLRKTPLMKIRDMPDSCDVEDWKIYQRSLVVQALERHMRPVGKWIVLFTAGSLGIPETVSEICEYNRTYYQSDGTYVHNPSAVCSCGKHPLPPCSAQQEPKE